MRHGLFQSSIPMVLFAFLTSYPAALSALSSIDTYLNGVKQALNGGWHPPPRRLLFVTKLKITVDKTGAIQKCETITPGESKDVQTSVDNCLRSVSLGPPPSEFGSLQLYLRFVLDQSVRVIDVTQYDPSLTQILSGTKPTGFDEVGFMSEVGKRIKRVWHPPRDSWFKIVVVDFSVTRSGDVSSAKIYKSSGDQALDLLALKAIPAAAPFPAIATESMDVRFTFGDWVVAGFQRGLPYER